MVFAASMGQPGTKTLLPCGRCIGCRLEHSRQWAVRSVHEISLHDQNCFVTLTFSNENLPSNYSISKRDLQLFFKRLRKKISKKVKYFACGEYGEKNNRPHYHAIIFGYDFPDKTPTGKSGDNIIYNSAELSSIWPFGHAVIGEANFQTAAYIARYCTKKFTNKDPEQVKSHYHLVDPETGEYFDLEPEFALISQPPRS